MPDIVFGSNCIKISGRLNRNDSWTPLLEWNTKDALSKVIHEYPTYISPMDYSLNENEKPSCGLNETSGDRIQLSFASSWKASR